MTSARVSPILTVANEANRPFWEYMGFAIDESLPLSFIEKIKTNSRTGGKQSINAAGTTLCLKAITSILKVHKKEIEGKYTGTILKQKLKDYQDRLDFFSESGEFKTFFERPLLDGKYSTWYKSVFKKSILMI